MASPPSTTTTASKRRPRRVSYDNPSEDPQLSPHWQSLQHLQTDKLLQGFDELKGQFQADLSKWNSESESGSSSSTDKDVVLAVWSTVCGYCEALTTHKDPLKRYRLFPIPMDALRRLVSAEFLPFCQQLKCDLNSTTTTNTNNNNKTETAVVIKHREAVRLVSNAVWKKAHGKSKNVRDELHANSLYVGFRGSIDKRSLDCFGAAVVTITALHNVLEGSSSYSFLTLSEDHAYESHCLGLTEKNVRSNNNINNNNNNNHNMLESKTFGTSEIALSGNTKEVQQTRGMDVSEALQKANKHKTLPYTVTPESSWLYMRKHPVICDTIPMTIAAVVGNINCQIVDKNTSNSSTSLTNFVASAPLLDLKRELLWILNDGGHLAKFPFALMELGECEEHRTTSRGLEWCDVTDMGIHDSVMGVEKLYLDAMAISRSTYGDAQAYPYFCAGHYHKDAVWEEHDNPSNSTNGGGYDSNPTCSFNPDQEYRLVEAVRLYSEASRVASQYRYDMQLMKHMTKAAMLVMNDILTQDQQDQQHQQQPRVWHNESNAIATGTWLLAFFDSLLLWEETCGGKQFCEILTPTHKFSMGKVLQQLKACVRRQVVDRLYPSASQSKAESEASVVVSVGTAPAAAVRGVDLSMAVTEHKLQYFSGPPRSKRLQRGSPLMAALSKEKVVIREMELTIPMSSDGGRRAKRARR